MRAVPGLDMSSDCLFDDVGWHMRRPGNRNGRARIDDPIEGLVVEGFEHVQCTMDCEMCVSIGVLVTWICPERPTFPYPKFSISLDSGGRLVCAAEFRTSKRIDASKCTTSSVVGKGKDRCETLPSPDLLIYSMRRSPTQKKITFADSTSCTKRGDATTSPSALHSSSASVRSGCRNRAILSGEGRHVEHTAASRAVERELRFQPARGVNG